LPLLYELSFGYASNYEVTPEYSKLLRNSNVKFIQMDVEDIDLRNRRVLGDKVVEYDQCVLALGITPRLDIIPGAKEYSFPFYTVDDSGRLNRHLNSLLKKNTEPLDVVVVGGGCSGVEVAANIAKFVGLRKGTITIVDRNEEIMTSSSTFNRKTSEK
jgi:NADH dehydrogenase FAD-containing subunit